MGFGPTGGGCSVVDRVSRWLQYLCTPLALDPLHMMGEVLGNRGVKVSFILLSLCELDHISKAAFLLYSTYTGLIVRKGRNKR